MEKNRMLGWTQTHEAVEQMMEGFRGESQPIGPKESQAADAPEPVQFRRKGSLYSIKYFWKEPDPLLMQVESMEFSDQNLRYLHFVDAKDGSDSVAFTHSGFTYVARKTTLKVAKRLLSAAERIGDCVSRVVAYFKTLAGNIYVLSRLEKATWSLDSTLSAPHIQGTSWEDFDSAHKEKFAELATEMMVKLHKSGHISANPIPSEIMLDSKKAFIADPRDLRPMRRTHDRVDNFILMLRGLIMRGLPSNGTLFYCLSVYVNSMEGECRAWYKKNKRSAPADLFQVAKELESRASA